MHAKLCPVKCADCRHEVVPHEEDYTIMLRHKTDMTMTFKRKGFFCHQKSFFFLDEKALHHENRLINNFITSCDNNSVA